LNAGVVAGNFYDGDAGENFGVAIEELPLAGLLNGLEIFGKVTGTIALGGIGGVGEFGGLNEILGVFECGHGLVVDQFGVAAGVVEMKMSVDDDVDLAGLNACGG
jgi:hypothetical protein